MSSPPTAAKSAAAPGADPLATGAGAPLQIDLDVDVDGALAAVAKAAEIWEAHFQRDGTAGRLVLPVLAGLRHGVLVGEVRASRREGPGSRLRFEVEHSEYAIHRGALMVLALGALGAVGVILAPLSLELLALAPFGLLLMLVAWFLVLAKVKHRNVQEFFETTTEIASQEIADSEKEHGILS